MRGQQKRHAHFTIESFRFDDENDYECEIQIQVFFLRTIKKQIPRKAASLFF